MLNEVHIEGVIAGKWSYNEALFLRLAVYADPGRGSRRSDAQGREVPDYVTLRCEGALALVGGSLREGDRIRAAGALTSREYDIGLEAFARKARGEEAALAELQGIAARLGRAAAMPHVLNEVVSERLTMVETAVERAEQREHRARRDERSQMTPDQPTLRQADRGQATPEAIAEGQSRGMPSETVATGEVAAAG
jgi:hypothetical protein